LPQWCKRVMLWIVGPGRTCKSPPAKNGGPTCLQIRVLASESGAPISPSSKRTIGSPTKSARFILVACSKCDWRAAFARDELIAAHGADYAMPNLLNHLAAPGCSRLGSQWDRCGVHYVEPIEGGYGDG
jgi:hypothetical protein